MATGRTHYRWARVYMDGYDFSGYTRKIGPLSTVFDEADGTTWADAVKGAFPSQVHLTAGDFGAVLDNDTAGLFALKATAGTKRLVTTCVGIRAEPAQGDPCFTVEANQLSYGGSDDGGLATVSLPMGEWASSATSLLYPRGWGAILNPNTARTGTNSSTGVDNLAATSTGGYMVYHVTASSNASHTATLLVEDSTDDNTYGAVSGMTTGSITVTAGVSGIVAIAPTASIKRYTRWQLTLGTATSVTFLMALVRG